MNFYEEGYELGTQQVDILLNGVDKLVEQMKSFDRSVEDISDFYYGVYKALLEGFQEAQERAERDA